MELADLPVRDPRPAITAERDDLVVLLAGFTDAEWVAPTEAGHRTGHGRRPPPARRRARLAVAGRATSSGRRPVPCPAGSTSAGT